MKAAVLSTIGSSTLEVRDNVEATPVTDGKVRVKIRATGVCHSDLSVVNGDRPRPLPMVLGHEAAGVVEEIGAGVTDVSAGDRVVCSYVPSCGHCAECAGGHPVRCADAQAANREAQGTGRWSINSKGILRLRR